jgi:hypothetical protein
VRSIRAIDCLDEREIMKIVSLRLLAVCALTLAPLSAFSADMKRSHCTAEETVYFSCSTGKKLLSYCGSGTISATSGYLQYRFGTPDKLEITVPATKDIASKSFFFESETNARADQIYTLSVKNGRTKYMLESQEGRAGTGTLTVIQNGPIATLECKTIYENLLNRLEHAGLPTQ